MRCKATDRQLRTVGSPTDREKPLCSLPRGHSALDSPGSPGDGDAVGGIDSKGQGPRELAGLLDQIVLAAPMHSCLEVRIEGAAVEFHQVQDCGCQSFHNLLCERKGSQGKVARPQCAPSCCHGTGEDGVPQGSSPQMPVGFQQPRRGSPSCGEMRKIKAGSQASLKMILNFKHSPYFYIGLLILCKMSFLLGNSGIDNCH